MLTEAQKREVFLRLRFCELDKMLPESQVAGLFNFA